MGMLADIYNSSAPRVVFFINKDDPTRGDSHGFEGIGQNLAHILDGTYEYLTMEHVQQSYPDINCMEAIKRYFAKKTPDILLTRDYDIHVHLTGKIKPKMTISDINEGLSRDLCGSECALVSHHLTDEKLQHEGEKFCEHYPDIRHPLIGFFMVNIHNPQLVVEKLLAKASHEKQATIFVCSSRRTNDYNYNEFVNILEREIKRKKLNIDVIGYGFKNKNEFNPYIGLLNKADHLVVSMDSLSMVSEALATGKSVYVLRPESGMNGLLKKGIAKDFMASPDDKPFQTKKITPVNLTQKIAFKLASRFYRKHKPVSSLMGLIRPISLRGR